MTAQASTFDGAAIPETKTEEKEPQLLDHEYDGIREYDNPLPGWWSAIFYGSIVFAAVYFVVFQIAGWPKTPAEKYKAAKLVWLAQHDREARAVASSSEGELSAGAKDSAIRERGHGIFVERCAMCHTADGHGLVGPNLTDLYQIHGTTRLDLFTTIRDGAPGTAMMPWGQQLPASDIVSVASFVSSLQGTNVPGGKAPQGQLVKPYAP